MGQENPQTPPRLIFTYGTLKRDFPHYDLIQSISASEHDVVSHLGTYVTLKPYPLVIGPHGLAFLINLPGEGHRVKGELYSLSSMDGLARLDDLEGTNRGHYERLPIKLEKFGGNDEVVEAEAYFVNGSLGQRMWEKSGRVGLCEYGLEEAMAYVKPKDRPVGSSFVADITRFINE